MAARLKARLFEKLRRLRPALIARLAAVWVLLAPSFAFSFFLSWRRMARWRRVSTCRNFMRKHARAFRDADPSTLVVESKAGGVSNSNEIWSCRRFGGGDARYFVKIFLPVGSFWARHLSWLSPFPRIRKGGMRERFKADRRGRVILPEHDVPVPRLVAYDADEKVLVTEWLEGVSVDEALKRVASRGRLSEDEREMICQCGGALARIHLAGLSLIDTQPVNCVWVAAERKVYFTDLEYCTREDRTAWDAGFFLSFLVLRLSGALRETAKSAFFEGYRLGRRPDVRSIEATARQLEDYAPLLEMILDAREYTPERLVEELSR